MTAPANACVVTPLKLALDHTAPNSKQVLSLYNFRNETLRFRVLATAPKRFSIKPARGELPSQSMMELIVRLVETDFVGTESLLVRFVNDRDEVVSATKVPVVVRASLATGATPSASSARPAASGLSMRVDATARPLGVGRVDSGALDVAPSAATTARRPMRTVLSALAGAGLVLGALAVYVAVVDVDGVVRKTLWQQLALSTSQQFILVFLLGMLAMALLREL